MRKRGRIMLAAVVLVALGGFTWLVLRPREPEYGGQSLSHWLRGYDPRVVVGNKDEVDDAIRHIGTNAIPTLLQMLRESDSPLKSKLISMIDRQNWMPIYMLPSMDKNGAASKAFIVLGPDAKDAAPSLIKIYEQKISVTSQYSTAEAIGGIGPAAIDAIPALIQGLRTTNWDVRLDTAWALGRIHSEPATVLPELQKLLHDPNLYVRMATVKALQAFGTNATPAVPELTAMLNDQNKHMRVAATNALNQINPEAAAKAGVK
jgi:hypothetical protein